MSDGLVTILNDGSGGGVLMAHNFFHGTVEADGRRVERNTWTLLAGMPKAVEHITLVSEVTHFSGPGGATRAVGEHNETGAALAAKSKLCHEGRYVNPQAGDFDDIADEVAWMRHKREWLAVSESRTVRTPLAVDVKTVAVSTSQFLIPVYPTLEEFSAGELGRIGWVSAHLDAFLGDCARRACREAGIPFRGPLDGAVRDSRPQAGPVTASFWNHKRPAEVDFYHGGRPVASIVSPGDKAMPLVQAQAVIADIEAKVKQAVAEVRVYMADKPFDRVAVAAHVEDALDKLRKVRVNGESNIAAMRLANAALGAAKAIVATEAQA